MKKGFLLFAGLLGLTLTACAGNGGMTEPVTESNVSVSSSTEDSNIASSSEKAEAEEVGYPGMVAIDASDVLDGEYQITVDSSSPMFNIVDCKLFVKNGEMTAKMTMSGKGYLYIYPGTEEEAAEADESTYIPYEEVDDAHVFTLEVPALNQVMDVSAFSKNKEKWYGRQLVFRADNVALEGGLISGGFVTAEDLGLADGKYTADVELLGGTGRVTLVSPCDIEVKDGKAFATIEWTSKNYDYMIVDDTKYDQINTEGNSLFTIPVRGFDFPIPVIGDTTAMSEPHEIEYLLIFSNPKNK